MSFATKYPPISDNSAVKGAWNASASHNHDAFEAGWSTHDVLAGQPEVQAEALVWVHDETTRVDWEATTPPAVYVVLLLLDDARLSMHSDSHDMQERDCEAGVYYVSCPGEAVSVRCAGRCRALHVAVPAQMFWADNEAGHNCFSLGPARDVLLLQLARTLLTMKNEACGSSLTASVLHLFLDRLRQLREHIAPFITASQKTKLPNWRLKRVGNYVKAHLSEHVTLNDMAAAAGLSPMHFAAQFRATTGYRPHHYLLLCRLEQAKQLMIDPSRALLDIALEVGFHTQSHFTTVCKRFTGKTPCQWRVELLRLQRAA